MIKWKLNPPLLDILLQMSGTGTHAVSYPDYYTLSLPPRNHISNDYLFQHLSHSRTSPSHGGEVIDSRYPNTPERRLPSGVSLDATHTHSKQVRPTTTTPDNDGKPHPSSSPEQKDISAKAATTSGSRAPRKEASTVVIACRQWYRRGPDKNPGTRHRRCKKRPPEEAVSPPQKRRRITTEPASTNDSAPPKTTSKTKENMASNRPSPPSSSSSPKHHERSQLRSQEPPQSHPPSPVNLRISTEGLTSAAHDHSPTSRRHPTYASEQSPYIIRSPFPRQLDVNVMKSPHSQHQKLRVPTSPAVKQTQRVWWNMLLKDYPLAQIEQDLRYLFNDTGHWLSFVNMDYFFRTLLDEESRLSIQPALIYAGLAMATLMRSSEMEFKAPGRERALWLRDNAESYIQSSINSDWMDASLAEAAMIIALFETSAHPMYNPDRVEQALLTLDYIIRTTSLTTIDANDPDVLTFPAGCVPMTDLPDDSPDRKCTCIPPGAAQAPDPYSSWSYALPWDATWSETEIRDEECRRLCWSSLSLMCNYVSQCVAFNRDPPNFFLLDSANYALLFPGEIVDRASPTFRSTPCVSTKESIWALYCRSMLLWAFTNRLRTTDMLNDDKVELVYDAWSEAQSIQDSLRIHTCNMDTAIIYMCREYVYNTQITITQTLRSLQGLGSGPPIFKKRHAEEWWPLLTTWEARKDIS
ncbi:hypothetical protein H0H92_004121 [Tricholoma furcatifolium]|nr:hypothetical protein H0H92_004121 [Tricholoma furcatifolium]